MVLYDTMGWIQRGTVMQEMMNDIKTMLRYSHVFSCNSSLFLSIPSTPSFKTSISIAGDGLLPLEIKSYRRCCR